ncbi:MAG: hypothetical protein D6718_05195 [Acidobacteria bacterium]|nr:MAG: hypothetical protein D6718_05195 [Acidobacteriota bacterium]
MALEWVNPSDPDFAGVLVLRRLGSPVTDDPAPGSSYNLGDTVGASIVACVTPAGASSCVDLDASNDGTIHYYKVFSRDTSFNYAPGVETRGLPRTSLSYKWEFTTGAASLAPIGATPGEHVVTVGNDGLLYRMGELDGRRAGWTPPAVGGAVQSRPKVGDLDPDYDGTNDFTAFLTTQDGMLYRFRLDTPAPPEASANVLADAGCDPASSSLQAGPVVMLDAFDNNNNPADDVVVVATRCGVSNNKVLLYDHMLNLLDSYDGDESGSSADQVGSPTLGISNAAPKILYRDWADNLIYVPLHGDGDDNESILVIRVTHDGRFVVPPYSETVGLGDIDTTPVVFRYGTSNNTFLVFGNTAGTIYLYDAVNRTGPYPAPLARRDSYTPPVSDGPVKAVAVSSRIAAGNGFYEHWVVWTTDNTLHGIKVTAGTAKLGDSTHWSVNVPGASAPVLLRWVGGVPNTRAYVGSSDGHLYEVDVPTGTVIRSWLLEAGKTIGDPTFDYNDGLNQGIVVGSTSGMVHWVRLN